MRLRAFIGMWSILALVVGLTAVASGHLGDGARAEDQTIERSDGESTAGSTSTVVPGHGELRVEGTVTALHLKGALPDPREVALPLTVTAERGFGNGGELTAVLVDGRSSTIVWDGGRPFVLAAGDGLIPDPTVVDLLPNGVRLSLGGVTHRLASGTYRLDTPVAVGTSGVATPRDSVTFEASAESRFEAHGDANLVLGREQARRVIGVGRVELTGSLDLTHRSGTRPTTALTVDRAAFDLTLTPIGDGGWSIAGLVDSSGAG
ncbi:MAG: hypothetical protein ACT452_11660 [Microthrixaceae bacterium]